MVSANIPLEKLKNPTLKTFIEKYTKEKLYSLTQYRGVVLEKVFKSKMDQIKKEIMSSDATYLIFDESTDSVGRYMLNILIGSCFSDRRSIPKLIAVVELEKTDSLNVNSNVISALNNFFDKKIEEINKVKLILSDAAPYAVKAAKMLKEMIPGLKHITCLCHAVHNLCETIRGQYLKIDRLIVYLKR